MASSVSRYTGSPPRRPRKLAKWVIAAPLLLLSLAALSNAADEMEEDMPAETPVFHWDEATNVWKDEQGRDYPVHPGTGKILVRGDFAVDENGQRLNEEGEAMTDPDSYFIPTQEGYWSGRETIEDIKGLGNPCGLKPLDTGTTTADPASWIARTVNHLKINVQKVPGRKLRFLKFWKKSPEENIPACNVDSFGKNLDLAMEYKGSLGLQMNQLIKKTIMAAVLYDLARRRRLGKMRSKAWCFIKYLPGLPSWKKCDKTSYGWDIVSGYAMCKSDKWKICAAAAGVQRPGTEIQYEAAET